MNKKAYIQKIPTAFVQVELKPWKSLGLRRRTQMFDLFVKPELGARLLQF